MTGFTFLDNTGSNPASAGKVYVFTSSPSGLLTPSDLPTYTEDLLGISDSWNGSVYGFSGGLNLDANTTYWILTDTDGFEVGNDFSNPNNAIYAISSGNNYVNQLQRINYQVTGIAVSALNSAPTDITLSSTSVDQSAGVNATVGQLSTVDPDENDTHTYSLVSGDGDTNNTSFNISGDELRVNDASSMASGDYSVRIQTDDGTDTFAKAFTITIIAPSSLGDAIVYIEHLKQGDPGIDRMGGASDPVVSPDGRHVYVAAYSSSAINIFSRDAASGELSYAGAAVHNVGGVQNMQSAFSVDISPDGKHVYVGSPTSHAVVVLARDENTGQLTFVESQATANEAFTVGGFIMVSVSPDGKSVYGVGGSGVHGLVVFDRNPETGSLTYVEEHIAGQNGNKLTQGFSATASPINNIDFSAAGDYLYVTSTSDHAVSVYARNTDTGSLMLEQVAENGLNGVQGIEAASSLVVSPDENFIYVIGQGQNAVSVFSRNKDTGHITYLEHYSNGSGGISTMAQARSLAMSPDGRYLYVSAIQSNAITVFERNVHTGTLSLAASRVNGQDGVLGISAVSGIVTDPLNQHLYSAGQGEHAIAVFSLPIPGIVLASVTATADESGPAVTLDDQLLIFDSDDTHLQSGSVTIESGFKPGDQLHVTTQGGVTADYDAATGVLTLLGSATLETYRDILRSASFQAGSDPDIGAGETAERTIAFRVNDGDNESAGAVITVTVQGVSGPVAEIFSPANGATDIGLQPTLSLTFDKEIILGSEGSFILKNGTTDVLIYDLSVSEDRDQFSLSGDSKTLNINISDPLPNNTSLSVEIQNGSTGNIIEDIHGNAFEGFLASSDTWTFTTIANTAPVAGNVTFSGSLNAGEELTASYDYSDVNDDAESGTTYQWYRSDDGQGTGKAAITGAASISYTSTGDDVGKYVSFEVTPNDGIEFGSAVESTLQGPVFTVPELATSAASGVEAVEATLNAEVTTDNFDLVSDRGFVYGLTATPTLAADSVLTSGDGVGTYSALAQNLLPNRTYYVRSYAINGAGTVYGNEVNFTTGKKELTLAGSFTALDKVYDGTTTVTTSENNLEVTGLEGTDQASLASFELHFAQADTGSAIAATVANPVLEGPDAENYTVTADGAPTSSASILPRELTIGGKFAIAEKRYDGTTGAVMDDNSLSLNGIVGTETVTLNDIELNFPQADAGTGLIVSLSSPVIGGADTSNYTVTVDGAPTLTANLLPYVLTLSEFTADEKVYDGAADVTGTGFSDDRFDGDQIDFSYDAEFENIQAGTGINVNYTNIAVSGGPDQNNYTLDSSIGTTTADIGQRPVSLAANAASKVYGDDDPQFTYELTSGSVVGTDSFSGSLHRTGDESVGVYTINLGSLSAGINYSVTFASADFEITQKALTIVANSDQTKVYGDADPVLSFTTSGFEFSEDETILTGALDRAAGVDAGIYTIGTGNLDAGNNYSISFTSTDFEITPRPVTLTNFVANDKTYDGSTDVTGTGFDNDRIEGDELEFTYSAAFVDKNNGVGKTVNYTDISISGGNDQNNYSLAVSSASIYADIMPKTVSIIDVIAENKVYDGTIEAVLAEQGMISGLAEGETLTLASPENVNFEDEIVGTGKHVVASGYRIEDGVSGDLASNYLLDTDEVAVTADILKKHLSVIVRNDEKVVDDEPYSGGNGINFDGFINGENEGVLDGSLMYGGIAQGALNPGSYTIEVSGFTSPNYDIEYTEGILTILSIPTAENPFPVDGSDRISTDTAIIVEFDQVVTALDLSGIQIRYHNQTGQVEAVESVTGSVADNILTVSHTGLNFDTEYTVSIPEGVVENADQVGNERFEWSFTTMISPPVKVNLTAPAENEGRVNRLPQFTWQATDDAETYQIQVAPDQDFMNPVIDLDDIQESAYAAGLQLDYHKRYYWRVRSFNYSGISEWSDTSVFVTIAESPVTVFPVHESENISTAPDIQWSSGHESTRYRLQLAGSDDFNKTIPDTLVNEDIIRLTGLAGDQGYFWRVKVESDLTESNWSQINSFRTRLDPVIGEDQTVSVGIEFGEASPTNRRELTGLDYRLIGFPGRDAYKLDQFFNGEYGSGWRAFVDNGNDFDYYDEYTPNDNRFRFTPGKGFWVLSTAELDFELAINNVEINERDGYDIALQPGWNIISNPHRGPVSWTDVLELNDFQADLYEYNERFVLADSLQPVQGYYIYNNPQHPLSSINIPYSSMQQRRRAESERAALNAAVEEHPSQASLKAIFNGDTELKVGLIFRNQTDGTLNEDINWRRYYPSLDLSKMGMMMIDEDVERGGLIRDEAYYSEQGQEYQVKLKSEVGRSFIWSAEMSGLPGQARMLLVNPVTNQSWMLADGESVEMTVSEPEATYRMYVGDQQWLEGHQEELLPQDIVLEQNYPNPFNPVTNIRYSLPNQQNVRLEIYDVIGRRVQVLQNGVQQPGWHLVQFDGNNLSSGLYFYRLQTNNSIKTGSMMLIK